MKFLKKYRIKKTDTQDLRKKVEIDPFFYWKKILLIMFIILMLVVVACFVLYYGVSKGMFVNKKSKQEIQDLESVILKTDKLDKLVKLFKEREEIRKNILESENIITDPSIQSLNNLINQSNSEIVQNP